MIIKKRKERHCVNGRRLCNRRNDDGEAKENKEEKKEGGGGEGRGGEGREKELLGIKTNSLIV